MTNAELVVLGLLAERERYPYEIESEIKARDLRAWARIGFSSIYRSLRTLEEKGLATSWKTDSPRGPDRRIHTITDEGVAALRAEVAARLAELLPPPSSFYVGLSLISHLDRGEVLASLRRHAEQIATQRRDMEKPSAGEPRLTRAMRDLGVALTRAEESWLAAFIGEVETAPAHE